MTPNPNPSPECICGKRFTMCEDGHAIDCPASNQFAKWEEMATPAALSQTLPAPGEVDFKALLIEAGRNAGALLDDRVSDDFLKGIPEEVRLKIERLREDTRTIQRNTATYRQEARAEADAANERAAEANKRADNMAEANRRLLVLFEADPSSLATVAAANDEGVAEQAAQFADGVAEGAQSLYDLAARDRDTVGTLIHGEAVRVAKHIAAAIRLLPQGEGK